ncbi:MAG: hypothetical protein ABIA74_04105 [bacterium]
MDKSKMYSEIHPGKKNISVFKAFHPSKVIHIQQYTEQINENIKLKKLSTSYPHSYPHSFKKVITRPDDGSQQKKRELSTYPHHLLPLL